MKYSILLGLFLAALSWAEEPIVQAALMDDRTQCKEWAVMDGIAEDYMNEYIDECLQNMNYQEPEVESYDYNEPAEEPVSE